MPSWSGRRQKRDALEHAAMGVSLAGDLLKAAAILGDKIRQFLDCAQLLRAQAVGRGGRQGWRGLRVWEQYSETVSAWRK